MKLKSIVLATTLMVGASSTYAGSFINIDTSLTSLSSANGGLTEGGQNPNTDKLYLEALNINFLSGYDDVTSPDDGGLGNLVASSLDYRAFNPSSNSAGRTTLYTGTLTLLDWRVSTGQPLGNTPGIGFDGDGNDLSTTPQATVYDFVYRDSYDGKLVFGMRYLNVADNGQEANYLYRDNFEGYSASAAWTFLSDYDLRMYQAGRTESPTHAQPVTFDDGSIRMKGDFSVSEGNPWSGLFLIKTDATEYSLQQGSIGWAQAGEEGQSVVRNAISGFAPGVVAAPVPEPETYAMMLSGLGLIGWSARRRMKRA